MIYDITNKDSKLVEKNVDLLLKDIIKKYKSETGELNFTTTFEFRTKTYPEITYASKKIDTEFFFIEGHKFKPKEVEKLSFLTLLCALRNSSITGVDITHKYQQYFIKAMEYASEIGFVFNEREMLLLKKHAAETINSMHETIGQNNHNDKRFSKINIDKHFINSNYEQISRSIELIKSAVMNLPGNIKPSFLTSITKATMNIFSIREQSNNINQSRNTTKL